MEGSGAEYGIEDFLEIKSIIGINSPSKNNCNYNLNQRNYILYLDC